MLNQTNKSIRSPRLLYRLCCALAVIACSFSLIVGLLMVTNLLTIRTASPLNLPELTQLQSSLKANPADEAIRTKIRELDVIARSFYFGGLHSLQIGTFLLLGGTMVALLSLKAIAHLRRRQPDPREFPSLPDPSEAAATARWVSGGIAIVLITGTVALSLRLKTPSPQSVTLTGVPPPTAGILAPPQNGANAAGEDTSTRWPSFRGQYGRGVSEATNLPTDWDGPSGRGILWKTPTPLPGMSSPVAWGNKVYLTGATAEKREVYCYDLSTGTLLWQKETPATGTKLSPNVNQDTGYAASTPVTDGTSIYSIFANGDIAAIDHCSQIKWTADLGLPINRYGFASSLTLYKNSILIQYDNQTDKGGISKLIALDTTSGKQSWVISRPVTDSWPSPVLIQTVKGPQLITAANEWIIAYNPESGGELWRVKVNGTDSSASPIFAGGLVLASVAADRIYAIRPDGHGDVTSTHIAWQSETGISDVASPVSNGELMFSITTSGALTCLEVATGKIIWEQSLEGEFYASPGLAGDRLYLVARSGQVFILKAGRQYVELGKANLGEPSAGSPAFINGKILIRGSNNLFCIGGP